MRTGLFADEKVVLAKHNQSGWGSKTVAWWGPMTVGTADIFVGIFSGGATVPNRKGDWHAGSFYLTNQRIIFEGTNKAADQIVNLKDIDSSIFTDTGKKEKKVIGEGETHLFVTEEDGTEHRFALVVPKEAQEVQKQLVDFNQEVTIQKAKHCEEVLDYKKAIKLWEKIGEPKEATRVRKLKADLAAPKTEIHGDYVDDRDTIVKDSVINRSNVGGSSKMQELEKLAEMKDKGIIDDAEFKQMKKEILGK
jgi:hypothetical protein